MAPCQTKINFVCIFLYNIIQKLPVISSKSYMQYFKKERSDNTNAVVPGLYVWQVNHSCTLLTFSCLISQENLQNVHMYSISHNKARY